MPNNDPTKQGSDSNTVTTPPPVLEDIVLPPMTDNKPISEIKEKVTDTGSAAPSDDIVMQTQPISSNPRKKFAGGRVIATILGLFLLVGGLGAGVMLVGQNQNPNEQAGCFSDCIAIPGNTAGECNNACGGSVSNPNQCGNGDCDSGENANNCPSDCKVDTTNPDNWNCTPGSTRPKSCQWQSGAKNCPGTMTEVCSANGMVWNAQTTCRDIVGDSCGEIVTTPGCGPSDPNSINGYCTNINAEEDCIGGRMICTASQYCHCQGGVQCPVGVCVAKSKFETACTGDGRVIASNPLHSNAKTCCERNYIAGPGGVGCVLPTSTNPTNPPSNPPKATPTPPAISASCQNLKAYPMSGNTSVPLTTAQLSALKSADQFNLCVQGIKTGGSFDKVRFTINGVLQPEQAMTDRIGTTTEGQFCTVYTIPQVLPANGAFSFSAEMHHVTLGWK